MAKCKGCTNSCRLTINQFLRRTPVSSAATAVSAVLGKEKNKESIPNLFDYKNKRLFVL
ncbi:MAG: hypothetical protein ACLSHW_06145 [Lachnospiraceae bacterium]